MCLTFTKSKFLKILNFGIKKKKMSTTRLLPRKRLKKSACRQKKLPLKPKNVLLNMVGKMIFETLTPLAKLDQMLTMII